MATPQLFLFTRLGLDPEPVSKLENDKHKNPVAISEREGEKGKDLQRNRERVFALQQKMAVMQGTGQCLSEGVFLVGLGV